MKKSLYLLLLLISAFSFSQVGIGTTTPHASAVLDLTSTTQGFLPPRMTQAQRTAISSPAAGLIIWCTNCGTAGEFQGYNGTNWTILSSSPVGTISALNCGSTSNSGTLVSGVAASSVSFVISYSGGNSGPHDGQTVTSTGVTGLTATLSAGVFASTGSLTYTIAGTPTSSGPASFAINIGGKACTVTRTVSAGEITSTNCPGTNNGTLVNGVAASSVNSILSYTGGNAGPYSEQSVNSTGVTGLTATLSAGVFASTGDLTYTITGTPASSGTASFAISIGGQTCTLTRTVATAPPGAPTNIVATVGNAHVSIAFTSPASTGDSVITGYTVTSTSGGFTATGASSPLLVTGLTNGTAYTFTVVATNAAGNSVASAPSVAVTPSLVTAVVLVAPGVAKQFLSHNLGADTSLDPNTPVVGLQGAYIQWGNRGPNTTGNSSVDWQTAANTANFAAAPTSGSANDAAISGWNTTPAANGSWGATKTANDPCPTGYRVPTSAEWTGVNTNNTESRTGTFSNSSTNYGVALHYGPNASTKLLTLPAAGYRSFTDGTISLRGFYGYYWSSTENGTNSFNLFFSDGNVLPADNLNRTYGFSLRCIAE